MKALVTGGAGFIASHVVDAYLKEGLDVVVVDDLTRGSVENFNPRARFYDADIRNYEAMRKIFETECPDYINHHAAQMDLRRGVVEPVFDAEVNILGSIHLLNLAVEFKVKRFVYASSGGGGYGEPLQVPIPEGHAVNPITPYGISKHTVEHYLFTYNVLYALQYVVLRYGNVYGPRQSSKGEAGVVAIFCEQMLQNVTPKIFGDGTKTRDYVRSEEHTSELQSLAYLVCRLLLEKKKYSAARHLRRCRLWLCPRPSARFRASARPGESR